MDGKVGHTVLVVSVVRRKCRRRRATRWHHNADGAPHMDLRRARAIRRTLQLKLGPLRHESSSGKWETDSQSRKRW